MYGAMGLELCARLVARAWLSTDYLGEPMVLIRVPGRTAVSALRVPSA
jgi:hypothetical protein